MDKITFGIGAKDDPRNVNLLVENIRRDYGNMDYEIIVVLDGGERMEIKGDDVRVIHYGDNRGIGHALDTAVDAATTEQVLIMGCDVIFRDFDVTGFLDIVRSNPMSLVCTTTIGATQMDKHLDKSKVDRCGAELIWEVTPELNQMKDPLPYRRYLEAKWLPRQSTGTYVVPCILGAFYGVNKQWYKNIKGFSQHRRWGNLEPLISMRSYMMGGDCKIASDYFMGHHFGRDGHATRCVSSMLWNKMLMAVTMMPEWMVKEVAAFVCDADPIGEYIVDEAYGSATLTDLRNYYVGTMSEYENEFIMAKIGL
jgi:glycosyltransferase involved in cell wall biosynthesis